MLKHTVSGLGSRHVSQDPRGQPISPHVYHPDQQPPPPNGIIPSSRSPYRHPPPALLNQSYPGTVSHNRSFSHGNPYSNTSTLSNSKHSIGGTPASISPLCSLPNGGLNISRQPPPLPSHPVPFGSSYAEAVNPRIVHNPYGTHLNISTLSTSKHSLGGNSSSVSPLTSGPPPRLANGGANISRTSTRSNGGHGGSGPPSIPPLPSPSNGSFLRGTREMLTSLGLLCLVSLLLALLSLVFMLKISPVTATDVKDFIRSDQVTVISPDEYVLVYEVTLALCALSLSLNLCCLLVCAVQFLFAVKLVRDSPDGERTNKYLKKSAFTRICAVGGFFVSIPVFLTGIILYTFIQFHSTPAVITSVLIGMGIIFCGCAMVHNVFVWQKEKTNAVRELAQQQRSFHEQSLVDHSRTIAHSTFIHNGSISPGPLPHHNAAMDFSNTPTPPEICTLV